MNNKEKKAIIAASNAIDGTTPDGVILIRFQNEGDEGDVRVKASTFGVSGRNAILATVDLLGEVVKMSNSIEDQEEAKAFIMRELTSMFKGESQWGAVKG